MHHAAPSIWPAATAAAVTLLLFGLVTSLAFSLIGLALFAASLIGWVRESTRD